MTIANPPSTPPAEARLGEELPIFCEKCGYSLHGLAPIRCEHCEILQFHCPECGNHQPINTLRPAFQRILGRGRAWVINAMIAGRLIFFFICLMIWFAMGTAWSRGEWDQTGQPRGMRITFDCLLAFFMYGLPFALVSRMLLLRWKRGWAVGLVMATLVVAALSLGAMERMYDFAGPDNRKAHVFDGDFKWLLLITFAIIEVGCAVAWPLWTVIVRAFLRKSIAEALLDWQRGMSGKTAGVSRLATG